MSKNQQNFWRESATNLPAYLRISYKSPCLFANDLQISLPICRSLQISLPICESSTNLPAYLCQKFCLFLLIRPVITSITNVFNIFNVTDNNNNNNNNNNNQEVNSKECQFIFMKN